MCAHQSNQRHRNFLVIDASQKVRLGSTWEAELTCGQWPGGQDPDLRTPGSTRRPRFGGDAPKGISPRDRSGEGRDRPAGDLPPGREAPAGAAAPTWNGGFVEAHYTYNPQLVFTGRYELVHMSRQANPTLLSDQGNLDSFTVGARWYPIMFSRAGLAIAPEYSRATHGKTSPTFQNQTDSSVYIGFDFDY